MRRAAPILAAVLAVAAAAAGYAMLRPRTPAPPVFDGPLVAVPSGMEVRWLDTVEGEDGVWRFRFVAPAIRAGAADAVQDDMQALCDTYALAHLPAGAQPAQVVISLADRPVPFGQARPDAVQFFEAYRPEGATCVWEMF